MKSKLHISIVGHTNTGKTSLLRTLLRSTNFGEVKDAPSTTKSVSQVCLQEVFPSGSLYFYFYDTPGFEDAIALNTYVQEHFLPKSRKHYRQGFENFLQDDKAKTEFEQEAKIIQQLLRSDIAFYVIDCREKPRAKHEEELDILAQITLPVLPILNFSDTKNGELIRYQDQWMALLKSLGLYTYVEYDTFSPPEERRLFEKISVLLDEYYQPLQLWLNEREARNQQRLEQALSIVSELFVNLASYQKKSPKNGQEATTELLKTVLASAEQACIDELLALYHFTEEDVRLHQLDVQPVILDTDFFSTENLVRFGSLFMNGASVGAGSMVAIDVFTGFVSLGSAGLLGGVVGGMYNTSHYHVKRLLDYWRQEMTLSYDMRLLMIVLSKMLLLVQGLEGRGHASTQALEIQVSNVLKIKGLESEVNKCRIYPEWSYLQAQANFVLQGPKKRQEMIAALNQHWQQAMNKKNTK